VSIKRDNWRRTWKKASAEERRAAARALRTPTRLVSGTKWLLIGMLGISVAGHVALAPYVVRKNGGGVHADEGSYLQRVMQKERAKVISKEIRNRITMPPPPPDPEAVVENTFKQSLSGDVEKLVGNMLDTKVVRRLADRVAASLQDELAQVSQDIVAGKMTAEEIEKKHKELKEKAHELTTDELMKYREETQLERAEMSTTEWYESEMSPTLLGNINHALLVRRTHYAGLWWHTFCGKYSGWTRYRNWSNIEANGYLSGKVRQLKRLKAGLIGRYDRKPNAAWPGPGKEQAQIIDRVLQRIFNGTANMSNNAVTYPTPSWRAVIYGDIDRHNLAGKVFEVHLTDGILTEFWPDKEDAKIKIAESLDGLWDRLLDGAEKYREQAEAGASKDKLAELRDANFALIDSVCKEARKLLHPDARTLQELNTLVRISVLTGEARDRMFKYWTDSMVNALKPIIHDIAKGQFEKGIIVHKAGVDEAMKEFAEKVVPMLRRDIMRMVSARKFKRLIWAGTPARRGYKTPGGEPTNVPSDDDVKAEKAKLDKLLKAHPELAAYAARRREINTQYFEEAIDGTKDAILAQVLTGGLLLKQMYVFVEGVDYADKVKEKLDSRLAALQGRGQDLTSLTKEGLPDPQVPLVALFFGASKGHGTTLLPFDTTMTAKYYSSKAPERVLRASMPYLPVGPKLIGKDDVLPEQPKLKPTFKGHTPRFEAIPFLYKFPEIDGDLTDWGEIRPLVLSRGGPGPVLLYAAWSYQGFFFGYHVDLPEEEFYYPTEARVRKGMSEYHLRRAAEWPFTGDHCRLLFDTLDARMNRRGEPHVQEFVILPRGTDTLPNIPGMERKINSKRDAETKEWRGVKSTPYTFPEQPENRPDGSGPFRVTKVTKTGYTVEIFVPRNLFAVPVFSPGWHIGFDCCVAKGYQGRGRGKHGSARFWASSDAVRPGNRGGNRPDAWGDLLLLGTDARCIVQNADDKWRRTSEIIPGHSYLLTIIDPDRNLSLSQIDSVLVSAEVADPGVADNSGQDVEVFILKESGKNTGIFRGCIDTQPGSGRKVRGVLEVQPCQEVVLGYVDLADSKGVRNPITHLRLPVVAPVLQTVPKR